MTEKRGEPWVGHIHPNALGGRMKETYLWQKPCGTVPVLCIPLLEGERLKETHETPFDDIVEVTLDLTREPAHQGRGEDRRESHYVAYLVQSSPGLCRRKQGERRKG